MPNHDWDRAAPGELWRVQRLINTFDVEDGSDTLSAAWLVEHGLGETDDLEPVRSLREALRPLLLAHNGAPVDADAVATLDALSRSARVSVGFAPDGSPAPGGGRAGRPGAGDHRPGGG